MMELDFAPLVEAVAMLVATVAVPFVLLLANRWLGIQTTEKDAAALAAALRRGVSLGIHRYQSAPQGGSRAELVLEEAFGYLLRTSPKLIGRVTVGNPDMLKDRLKAEVANMLRAGEKVP